MTLPEVTEPGCDRARSKPRPFNSKLSFPFNHRSSCPFDFLFYLLRNLCWLSFQNIPCPHESIVPLLHSDLLSSLSLSGFRHKGKAPFMTREQMLPVCDSVSKHPPLLNNEKNCRSIALRCLWGGK